MNETKKFSFETKEISLPEELLDLLRKMSWQGPLDFVQESYDQDADFVMGWANFWSNPEKMRSVNNPAALFRKALTGDLYPPDEYLPAYREQIAQTVEAYQGMMQRAVEESLEQKTWKLVKTDLELQLPKATYDTHLLKTTCLEIDGGHLVVQVENPMVAEFLENRLYERVRSAVARTMKLHIEDVEIEFVVEEQ